MVKIDGTLDAQAMLLEDKDKTPEVLTRQAGERLSNEANDPFLPKPPFFIPVVGGIGRGKTTVILNMVNAWQENNTFCNVFYLSPSGLLDPKLRVFFKPDNEDFSYTPANLAAIEKKIRETTSKHNDGKAGPSRGGGSTTGASSRQIAAKLPRRQVAQQENGTGALVPERHMNQVRSPTEVARQARSCVSGRSLIIADDATGSLLAKRDGPFLPFLASIRHHNTSVLVGVHQFNSVAQQLKSFTTGFLLFQPGTGTEMATISKEVPSIEKDALMEMLREVGSMDHGSVLIDNKRSMPERFTLNMDSYLNPKKFEARTSKGRQRGLKEENEPLLQVASVAPTPTKPSPQEFAMRNRALDLHMRARKLNSELTPAQRAAAAKRKRTEEEKFAMDTQKARASQARAAKKQRTGVVQAENQATARSVRDGDRVTAKAARTFFQRIAATTDDPTTRATALKRIKDVRSKNPAVRAIALKTSAGAAGGLRLTPAGGLTRENPLPRSSRESRFSVFRGKGLGRGSRGGTNAALINANTAEARLNAAAAAERRVAEAKAQGTEVLTKEAQREEEALKIAEENKKKLEKATVDKIISESQTNREQTAMRTRLKGKKEDLEKLLNPVLSAQKKKQEEEKEREKQMEMLNPEEQELKLGAMNREEAISRMDKKKREENEMEEIVKKSQENREKTMSRTRLKVRKEDLEKVLNPVLRAQKEKEEAEKEAEKQRERLNPEEQELKLGAMIRDVAIARKGREQAAARAEQKLAGDSMEQFFKRKTEEKQAEEKKAQDAEDKRIAAEAKAAAKAAEEAAKVAAKEAEEAAKKESIMEVDTDFAEQNAKEAKTEAMLAKRLADIEARLAKEEEARKKAAAEEAKAAAKEVLPMDTEPIYVPKPPKPVADTPLTTTTTTTTTTTPTTSSLSPAAMDISKPERDAEVEIADLSAPAPVPKRFERFPTGEDVLKTDSLQFQNRPSISKTLKEAMALADKEQGLPTTSIREKKPSRSRVVVSNPLERARALAKEEPGVKSFPEQRDFNKRGPVAPDRVEGPARIPKRTRSEMNPTSSGENAEPLSSPREFKRLVAQELLNNPVPGLPPRPLTASQAGTEMSLGKMKPGKPSTGKGRGVSKKKMMPKTIPRVALAPADVTVVAPPASTPTPTTGSLAAMNSEMDLGASVSGRGQKRPPGS